MFLVAWTIKDPSVLKGFREISERLADFEEYETEYMPILQKAIDALCLQDHYSAHESYEEARDALDKLIERSSTMSKLYSATLSAVIASTDYEALQLRIKAHPMDGSIVSAEDNDDESEAMDLGAFFGVKFEKDKQPVRPSNPKAIP